MRRLRKSRNLSVPILQPVNIVFSIRGVMSNQQDAEMSLEQHRFRSLNIQTPVTLTNHHESCCCYRTAISAHNVA